MSSVQPWRASPSRLISSRVGEGWREAADRERRRRERARRREDRYVFAQLERWEARHGLWTNIDRVLALMRRWRREYREREASRIASPKLRA